MERVKMRRKIKLPMRATIWSIISGLVSRGAGVVGTPIFTRLLTPGEFGLYPLYVTWLAVANSLFVTGITGSAIYRGLQRHKGDEDAFITATIGLILTASIPIFGFGVLFGGVISRLSGLSERVLLMLFSEVVLGSVIAAKSARFRYEYNYPALAGINITAAIGSPLISLFFISFTPYRAEARIFGSIIMTAAVSLPTLLFSFSRGEKFFRADIWRYLMRVNLPLIPHYLSTSLILRIGEMVIGRAHGEGAIGKYSVAMSVGLWLTALTNALLQVFSPWIMRKLARSELGRVRDLVFSAFTLVMLGSLFILSFAPEILTVMTPREYRDALAAVYPLSLSVGLMFLSSVTLSGEIYYERSLATSLPTVATCALEILIALFVLPRVDYRVAAVFTYLAYLILFVLSSYTFRRLSGDNLVHIKETATVIFIGTAYAALFFFLRGVFISRLLLIIPLIPITVFLVGKIIKEARER